MRLKILDSLKRKVGIIKINEKLEIEEGNDLFKIQISKILKEGVKYLGGPEKESKEKGKVRDKIFVEKEFNEENLGLLENKLLELGYGMEEM